MQFIYKYYMAKILTYSNTMALLPLMTLAIMLSLSASSNTGQQRSKKANFSPSCRTNDPACVEIIGPDGCTLCKCKTVAFRSTEEWPKYITKVWYDDKGLLIIPTPAPNDPIPIMPSCKTLKCAEGWTCVHDDILCKHEHRCGPHCVKAESEYMDGDDDQQSAEADVPYIDNIESPNHEPHLSIVGVKIKGHECNAGHDKMH